MRIHSILLFSCSLILATGCHRFPSIVDSGATSAASIPVGPIPGAQTYRYTHDPLIGDPVALQDGRRLFNWYNCSGCHGGHAGGGMGPSLRDAVWIYGSHDEQIYDSIAQGRANGMPAWGSKIPQSQIWELVAYIKSLRTPQEPSPPVEPTNEMTPDPINNTMYGTGTQTSSSVITEPTGASDDTHQHNSSEIMGDANAARETSQSGAREPK